MFEAPFLEENIWSNLIDFHKTFFISRLWLPWLMIVFMVIAGLFWSLRKQLQNTTLYQNLFSPSCYLFDKKDAGQWAALGVLVAALITTALYLFNTENSFFDNFDMMALGTTRILQHGVVPNFDFARITPLAFWYLNILYAITQNMYLIKIFVFGQLLFAVWLMYSFFNYMPMVRRLLMLAAFLITPTVLLTAKIIFPEREIIILLMASLIFARRFSQTAKLADAAWFLFFMNFAFYTKETSILFYAGIIAASVLYHIWNEDILIKSFLNPLKLIKQLPLEFLMGMSIFMYAVIYFLLQQPNETNLYIVNNHYDWKVLIFYYQFELIILLAALAFLIHRMFVYSESKLNPMFQGGLVLGSLGVALGIIFILQMAPNSPHLLGKTYYLMLSLLFSLAYLFQHIISKAGAWVLAVVIIIYCAPIDYQKFENEEGIYYRGVAEFIGPKLDKEKITSLFIIEKPQQTPDIDKWVVEAWSTIYKYYVPDYKLVFKSPQHMPQSLIELVNLKRFFMDVYFPIVPQIKPQKGDWVIIRRENIDAKTQELRHSLGTPHYVDKLFEVYQAQ